QPAVPPGPGVAAEAPRLLSLPQPTKEPPPTMIITIATASALPTLSSLTDLAFSRIADACGAGGHSPRGVCQVTAKVCVPGTLTSGEHVNAQ
ncbi:MAG TPA: hypothetical protein VE441_00785, partial [Mycobacterium sp.]|nr:hypothetical protein [Mycobacterium sp.]